MVFDNLTDGRSAGQLRASIVAREIERADRDARRRSKRQMEEVERIFALRTRGLSLEEYREIIDRTFRAAELGRLEVVVMRFPAQACSDHGRAISAGSPGWPATLPKKARAFYDHWLRDERHKGYHLAATITDYRDGLPGDVGLILDWRPED